ncbi:hypothetical protein FOXYSP1_19069 [Fusarium oxysporum f. sp. phaseoli]
MPSILSFPAEITSLVLRELPSRDLLALRQTCKEFCDKATPHFARSYFTTRYTMVERRSLDALVEISKHHTLGPCVETLNICVYHLLPLEELPRIKHPYSEYEDMIKTLSPEQYEDFIENMASEENDTEFRGRTSFLRSLSFDNRNNHLSQLHRQAYLTSIADRDQLVRTRYAIECLEQAMGNLCHCKKVIIDDDNRAWGLRRWKKELGILPQRTLTFASASSVNLVRYIVHAVVTTLSTGKLSIDSLEISIGSLMENGNRISPHMLPTLSSSPITSLHRLHIVLDPTVLNPDIRLPWCSGLVRFVRLFPDLSDFSLEFEYRDESSRFLEIAAMLHIPKLKKFKLSLVDCKREELADFILYHKETICEISLESIDLVDGVQSWQSLIKDIHDHLNISYFSMDSCMARDTYSQPKGEELVATDAQGLMDIIARLSQSN